ncbi:hypothetical protein EV424DRAFT_1546980 [Suillus variegatus]|nr:hypothetical protein EV424DRAFT_1546980 [Suillus variegatus]
MAAPVVPSSFQIYNSYVEDPKWQIKFTIIWCSGLALTVVVSIPSLILGLRHGRSLKGITGISENDGYQPAHFDGKEPPPIRRRHRRLVGAWNALIPPRYCSPAKLGLNLGQIIVLLAYLAAVPVCIIKDVPLISNPNRAGQGNGYEKLNFMHRMAGRPMFFGGCIHGSLWIRNHLQYGLAILGPQKVTSGVASLALLSIIVLMSLRPVRRLFYECFFVVHVLTYVAFFVTICYHMLYASPWIFPPLAFYGADVLLRLFRYRIQDATLTAQDAHMTLIRVHNCDDSWLAGQHYSPVASYDSGSSPETNTSDSPLESPRSLSDIDMDSPPSDISAGSLPSYIPKPRFAPHGSTSNFSPRSLEVFGGPLPTLTPSPQPSPQVPRVLPALESPTTHHVNYLRARVQHASATIIHARVDAHPLPQSLTTQSLSNVILQSIPSRPRTGLSIGRNYKSARVPDFVQVLERTQ